MVLSPPVPGAWHCVWERGEGELPVSCFHAYLTPDRQKKSNCFSDILADRIIESVQSPRSRLHCPCLIGEGFKAGLLRAITLSVEDSELWVLSGPSSVCSSHGASSP